MCTVSMIMDHYRDRWYPYTQPHPGGIAPNTTPLIDWGSLTNPSEPRISKEEVEEFRKLLERAREYDKAHNQPDCELDEKRQALKKIAAELGVDISFV